MIKSIRTRLIATFIGLGIVPLLLLGGVLSWKYTLLETDQVKSFQQQLTIQASENFSALLREQQHSLTVMMRSHDLLDMKREQQTAALTAFLFAANTREHGNVFDEIMILDMQGKEVLTVSRSNPAENRDARNWIATDEFVIPLELGGPAYTPVRIHQSTGEPFMHLSVPIMDERTETVRGILVARMQLQFMWSLISKTGFNASGLAFLVDHNGRIVGHPNSLVALENRHIAVPETPSIMRGIDGEMSIVAAERIRSAGQTLLLVTEVPTSEALRPLFRFIIIIGPVLLATLLGAIVLGLILVSQIVSPIESLAGTAKSISEGDLSQRANFERTDELGELATSFDAMTAQLVETIRDFETEKDFVKSTIESLSHPFYVIDAKDYTVKLANSAARLGTLAQGDKCYQLIHQSDGPCTGMGHPCTIREVNRTRKPVVVRHVHPIDDGTAITCDVHGYPIFDDEGEIQQVIEYIIDITERLSLEEQLLQAQKLEAIGSLASGVAHDFNNLLQVISAHAKLISDLVEPDSEVDESMQTVMYAVKQATGVTRSLLTFSHKVRAEKTPVDLGATVEQAAKMLRHTLPATIELRTEIDPETPLWVNADPTQLQQIILNLSINARDAMPGGGTLRISAFPHVSTASAQTPNEGETLGARIAISDTGTGMSPAIRERIFEPFFTTKGRGQGTGLGLSIIHSIVQDHEGRIEVESEVGTGSTFFIDLLCVTPICENDSDQSEIEPPKAHGELVLLAEDNSRVRDAIAKTLVSDGCEVVEAADGDAFLENFQLYGEDSRLLILDVDMPKRSGLECLQEVRALGFRTPAIVITASPDLQLEDQLDEYTILLPKPFPMMELGRIVLLQLSEDIEA